MRASITRSDKITIGEITVERDDEVYFLSDDRRFDGSDCRDKKNWKYSWYMGIYASELKNPRVLAERGLRLLDKAAGFFTRKVSY